MKKLTRRGFTAAGILAALGAASLPGCDVAGCSGPFEPSDNEVETVYGPPEYFGLEGESEDDPYDPSENELEDVYGPPEDFEPEENESESVYGPPAMG